MVTRHSSNYPGVVVVPSLPPPPKLVSRGAARILTNLRPYYLCVRRRWLYLRTYIHNVVGRIVS